jgi:putative PIN family toxin of toxin-antitoxin system
MNPDRNFVFDTNALVSAMLFARSVPGQALFTALDCGNMLVSQKTLAELSDVLKRTKFDRYLDRADRERFLTKFVEVAIVVDFIEEIHECRDPKDDKFLEVATSGSANCLVSGDEDLLTLNPFRGIPIMTPVQFLEWISRQISEQG